MKSNSDDNSNLNYFLVAVFSVAVFLSVCQMISIVFPYFVPPFPTDIDFLESKQWVVDEWHWMAAFYIHIFSSVFVLAAGLTQFSKTFLLKYPVLHRKIGKIYVFLVLCVACPSGFVMAFYGNGGWAARYAFILQALGWWFFTFMAYSTVKNRKLKEHSKYMIRSYAMTLSAISLRAATYIASVWKMNNGINCPDPEYFLICYPDFYILIAWLSWIVNLIIAEFMIIIGITEYYFPLKSSEE